MENKINVAELLKDCPPGMELDCTMYEGVVTFVKIDKYSSYPIVISVQHNGDITICQLTQTGQSCISSYTKCVIFPKGKTTWEGFVPPCKFKDGDILYIDCTGDECSYKHNKYIFILKEISDGKIYCYCYIDEVNKYKNFNISWLSDMTYTPRFATEEEKQKLFDAIRENGYKWNSETKTLEKLMEPNFKDGDILSSRYGNPFILKAHLPKSDSVSSYCALDFYDNFQEGCNRWAQASGCRLATEEEKQKLFDVIKANGLKWNEETKTLEKLIVPKFKVGDRIKYRHGEIIYRIVKITEDTYELDNYHSIPISLEYMYNLVPNKFDISTLIPYESKVLIRNTLCGHWEPAFWGAYTIDHSDGLLQHHDYLTTKGFTNYCIPYEGNEHLMGKTDDCIEYYKTWENKI